MESAPRLADGARLWRQRGDQEVHLWYADLVRPPGLVDELAALLSDEELKRARRFHFEKHRRRFLVRRGLLRRLLGAYLGLDPAAVEFAYGAREKPSVLTRPMPEPARRLEFNLSDSEDLVAYAIARGVEIGVDVEMLRPMPDALSIAESFFSEREREALRGVEDERRHRSFFRCWTRKEAYLKAIGEGLAEPLDSFSVSFLPGEEARFLEFRSASEDPASWTLVHLSPNDASVGALALRARGFTVAELGWL